MLAALVKRHCYVSYVVKNLIQSSQPQMVLKPKSWKSHIPAKPMSPCNSTLGILAGSRFITHQFFLTNRSLFLLAWHAQISSAKVLKHYGKLLLRQPLNYL
ncbi:hypothetical protein THIOM_005440 [Candidatus Thiomargarita nelsonii]|uniref:Uncharacterized protein n=1 Tax=Candidatus Thiomargarita nelsonii TaxID=1003181 RepID=A0A176RT83_9GAMM|nr:hypothetical protein THIOM_005440 [Candidatus Thiomargarita nelsonii]